MPRARTLSRMFLIRTFRNACVGGFAVLWAMTLAQPASADVWLFDKENTSVRFSWNHLGLSQQSGRFSEVDGRLEFSPTDPEGGEVDVVIKVASLSTGVKQYDANLRGVDFFNVAEHPLITFKSTGVRRTTEKMGELMGDLTIMGIAKPIVLQVVWNYTGEHPFASINPTFKGKWVSGFSATGTVLRSEWGLTRATPLISDEIRITIEAEFMLKDGSVLQ